MPDKKITKTPATQQIALTKEKHYQLKCYAARAAMSIKDALEVAVDLLLASEDDGK